MTLHFLEKAAGFIDREVWVKFKLEKLLVKLIEISRKRGEEIQNKAITEVALRKVMRLARAQQSIVAN
jgi:hypothetical protein